MDVLFSGNADIMKSEMTDARCEVPGARCERATSPVGVEGGEEGMNSTRVSILAMEEGVGVCGCRGVAGQVGPEAVRRSAGAAAARFLFGRVGM